MKELISVVACSVAFGSSLASAAGTIIMEKRIEATSLHPNIDNSAVLQFARDYASSPFQLTNVDADIKTNVPSGQYFVRELPQIDYRITDISCSLSTGATSIIQTYNYDNGPPTQLDTDQFKSGDNAISIQLQGTDTVECVFTNERVPCGNGIVDAQYGEQCDSTAGCDGHCRFQGSIKIVKTFAACKDEPIFEFNAPWNSKFFLGNGHANESGFLDSGTYTIKEVNLPSDWKLKDISCMCGDSACISSIVPDLASNGVTINLVGPEAVKCIFLNEFQPCTSASCAVCGNGRREGNEECDNGDMNSDTAAGRDQCTTHCRRPICGDGIIQESEECDSGSAFGDSSCDSQCRVVACLEPVCGNNVKEEGEQCDDGNLVTGDGCDDHCRIERCGDGKRNNDCNQEPTEECDDGSENGTRDEEDACDHHCRRVHKVSRPEGSSQQSALPATPVAATTNETTLAVATGCESLKGDSPLLFTLLLALWIAFLWRNRQPRKR